MSPSLFERGVEVMLLGMGTVIAFLSLLVIAIGLMHRLLERFYPSPVQIAATDGSAANARGTAAKQEVIVAIAAAVHCHRQRSHITRPRQEDASDG